MSMVDDEYIAHIDQMTVAEKMERSAAMLNWARDLIARQIRKTKPDISDERLRWEVADRQYQAEPEACSLIEEILSRVPA